MSDLLFQLLPALGFIVVIAARLRVMIARRKDDLFVMIDAEGWLQPRRLAAG